MTDEPDQPEHPEATLLAQLAASAEKQAALNRRVFGFAEPGPDADGERIGPVEHDDEGEAA